MRLDSNAQPFPLLNRGNRQRRVIAELLGLAKGIIADGVVSSAEAAFLRDWMRANPDAVDTWPCSVVARRLRGIYADGVVDEDERSELTDLLLDGTGGGLDQVEGNRDWIHSSFGTKIQKAVEDRDARGAPLTIVHEEDWAAAL